MIGAKGAACSRFPHRLPGSPGKLLHLCWLYEYECACILVCMYVYACVCTCVYAVCVILFFDMESYFATKAILKLTAVFLPQVPKCWNYRSGQSHPASMLTICGKGPLSLCSDSITINYSKAQNLGKQSYSWL